MYDRVLPQLWMLLPQAQRQHLAVVFDIPKSGISEIRDQTVLSDGHTIEDLSAISAEKMELYVGSKEPFPRLWELTVAKCHSELNPPIGIIKATEEQHEPADEQMNTGAVIEPKHAKKTTKK